MENREMRGFESMGSIVQEQSQDTLVEVFFKDENWKSKIEKLWELLTVSTEVLMSNDLGVSSKAKIENQSIGKELHLSSTQARKS